jgi:peptidoglycan/xylan/chitin deacetylase (PgdA/CDA1 family)
VTRPTDTLLVRERDLGDHGDPGPRDLSHASPLPTWAQPVLLALSSVMRVRTDERVIALTYDDGPRPEHTGPILAELAARGVRATFFVLTDRAEESPAMISQMLAAGHEVALHGIDHTRLTEVPGLQAARRVREGKRRLERVTGAPVTMYRPTYGAQGLAQFLTARLLGMQVVYWTAWAQDWFDDTAEAVAARAVRARHPGAVLLLHDTTDDTPVDEQARGRPTFSRGEVTARVLDALLADGYRVVPVGELITGHPVVRAVTTQRPWVSLRRRLARVRHGATPPSA